MANKNWFSIAAKGPEANVYIFDEIGAFGVTAKTFIDQLQAQGRGRNITLHVNSPGGNMFEAFAIYNALDAYPGKVTAIIEGVAASAASYIVMGADKVVMPENALMMIHNPAALTGGGADDLRDMAVLLDNIKKSMVSAYARKSGLTESRIAEMLTAETWMTATEAKALGFADEVRAPVKVAASFNLSKFSRAPAPKTPETMAELSDQFWAKRGKAPAPDALADEDISDLIPTPRSHAETWERFNAQGRGPDGKRGGVK